MRHDSTLLTLVLNSAEGVLQIVLGHTFLDETFSVVNAASICAASRGAEALTPALQKMLRACAIPAGGIKRIACVRGPGGFTGIRLGTATALGIARACGATLAGLDYLPLLAENALAAYPKARREQAQKAAWAILHARRNEVVLQGFAKNLVPITPALACSLKDAAQLMQKHGVPLAVFGSGLLRNAQELADLFPEAASSFLLEDIACLSPESLLKAAAKAAYDLSPIEPAYVRACDAEQNLPEIAKAMGQNPDDAVSKFAALTRPHPMK